MVKIQWVTDYFSITIKSFNYSAIEVRIADAKVFICIKQWNIANLPSLNLVRTKFMTVGVRNENVI